MPKRIVAARGIFGTFSRAVRGVTTSPRVDAVLQRVVYKRGVITDGVSSQLQPFEQRVLSQNGEHGILKELCFRLGLTGGYFVEFGVQDGTECNTAVFAQVYGWSGLYIEGDAQYVKRLREVYRDAPQVQIANAFLTAENIAGILEKHGVPVEFDVLSIDVDGNDFWLWKALGRYGPKIVVVEYNAAYPPPMKWIMAYRPDHLWDGSSYFGASLAALANLGNALGYALVGTESRGINAFFVRGDLLAQTKFRELSPEQAYHAPRYGALRIPYPYREGQALEGSAAEEAARL